jgi:hypothetical protein
MNNKRRLIDLNVQSTKKKTKSTDININDINMDNVFGNIVINMLKWTDMPVVALVCKKWRSMAFENRKFETEYIKGRMDNIFISHKEVKYMMRYKNARMMIQESFDMNCITKNTSTVKQEDGIGLKGTHSRRSYIMKMQVLIGSMLLDINCCDQFCLLHNIMCFSSGYTISYYINYKLNTKPTPEMYTELIHRCLFISSGTSKDVTRVMELFKFGPTNGDYKLLLEHSYALSDKYFTLLRASVSISNTSLIRSIFNSGLVDPSKYKGIHIFRDVCTTGDLEIVELFLKHGFKPLDAEDYKDCIYRYNLFVYRGQMIRLFSKYIPEFVETLEDHGYSVVIYGSGSFFVRFY